MHFTDGRGTDLPRQLLQARGDDEAEDEAVRQNGEPRFALRRSSLGTKVVNLKTMFCTDLSSAQARTQKEATNKKARTEGRHLCFLRTKKIEKPHVTTRNELIIRH